MERVFLQANILLIGAGKMGGALLSAWLHAGVTPESITVIEPNTDPARKQGVKTFACLSEVTKTPDCIVLAVKPQSMEGLLRDLAERLPTYSFPRRGEIGRGADSHRYPLYLSIAAGKTLAYFEQYLGSVSIVRAMPNTPALIRQGITALCANRYVSESQKQLAASLMQAAGETVWLDEESQMDAVTAISGSGPAYVFLFLEALIAAGKAQGLPEDIAHTLALQTVCGSVKLAQKLTEPLAQLRKNVTSPGGTTEAALEVLMKNNILQTLMSNAVAAAVKRAKELGK